MLRVARRKLPGIPFRRGDMRDFVVPGRFDVLTCLFSAIGYLEDDAALSATFARFFAALRPGGVALIEPWLRPVDWRPGGVHLLEAGDRERSVARMNASDRDGEFSIMVMHYLVGDRRGVRHFVEHHRMRLVPHGHLLQLLRRAGFHPRLERSVMPLGRGLLVAVRPAEPPARRSGGSGRRTKP
jgi:SAM-dependent methyltransferase